MLSISKRDENQVCPSCGESMTREITAAVLHGVGGNPASNDFEDSTKNELAAALKENDQHRRDEDRRIKQAIVNGEDGI